MGFSHQQNSGQGVEKYFGSSYPLVRGEGQQHAADEVEREEDTPERKMNVKLRADSYDWTEKSSELELPNKEVIADVDPPLEDARNEVERVNSYDWTQIYTKEHHPEKEGADSSDIVDGKQQYIQERIDASDYHLGGTGVGNPFRLDTNLSHDSSQNDLSLSGRTASNNHLEHNEGNNALLAHEGAPIFDGSQHQIIQRLPSLEDDPYYTYPNLFSKPSHGSALP